MKSLKYSVSFIVLVLVISWGYFAYVFAKPERTDLFVFVMIFPAIIALIINFIRYKSFKEVFKPLTTRLNIKSLGFALFYPVIFIGAIAFLVWLFGIAEFNKETFSNSSLHLGLANIVIAFFLMFGEEYGWRGFLLKDLAEVKGKVFAAVIVGIVWALWHAPAVYGLANVYEYDSPLLLTFVQMLAVFIFSMPFAHSYFMSGNILPPMIFHFVWNLFNPMVLGNIYRNTPGIMEGNNLLINGEAIAGVVLGLIFFIWYILKYRSKEVVAE
ncbi:MAG: CPBP family intramembrane metalloprotease [Bacteroidales bacterium]|nr:CPBP family intramembrane metalloprotease [Bacteroidales bacterium]